jgi:2-C-methyl-D-erythritol 2,4-cyclodiphosphate synthase
LERRTTPTPLPGHVHLTVVFYRAGHNYGYRHPGRYLSNHTRGAGGEPVGDGTVSTSAVRVGQGFDTHRFGEGDHVMLGGVKIPYRQGVVAHSDGDVVLHALADALLGAAALGDIGHSFPDDDAQWAGADSAELLRQIVHRVAQAGWCVLNVDCTVVTERPRVAPHVPAMRKRIAGILNVEPNAVSIKATTVERMGFIGREEGLAAFAIALLASDE